MSVTASDLKSGRLAPGRFGLAVGAVYLASFFSQVLLSAPVTARLSVAPFVLVQAVLIWLWIGVHRRRLRDAGRPAGTAFGVAAVYALEIVLLTLIVYILSSATEASGGASTDAGIFHLFIILYLLGVMTGDPTLGVLQIWLIAFVVLMLIPVVIAIGFSIWAATRPPATVPP